MEAALSKTFALPLTKPIAGAYVPLQDLGRRLDQPAAPWLQDLTDQAEEAVKHVCDGAWPATLPALVKVARKLTGWRLIFEYQEPLVPAHAIDGRLVIPGIGDVLHDYGLALHEIIETWLKLPGSALLNTPGDALTPHDVAVVVTDLYRTWLRFAIAAGETIQEIKRRRRHRPDLSTLVMTYEADETADAPPTEASPPVVWCEVTDPDFTEGE
jgi:hypothetical protein